METISALILAGGKSERMTHPKPWLMLDGQTFAEKIIDTYISAGIEKIVLVINKEFCGNEWQNTLQKIKAKTESAILFFMKRSP